LAGSEKLGTAVLELKTDSTGLNAGIASAKTRVGGLGAVLGSVGGIAAGLFAGRAIVGGIKEMVDVSADFETQIKLLEVAAKGSGVSFDDLSDVALQTGADTSLIGISASQSADALTNFYKAGLKTSDIFGGAGGLNAYMEEGAELSGAFRAAIDLQAASELNLDQASDLLATTMSTFGISAEEATKITDNLVQSADASVTSVPELAAAMETVGSTFASFYGESLGGMGTLEELNNLLAVLSSRGIRGAEAGTALKSMMMQLLTPASAAKDALAAAGFHAFTATGDIRGMGEMMDELGTILLKNASTSGLTVGMTLAQSRAFHKLQEEYDGLVASSTELTEKVEGGAGATEEEVRQYWALQDTLAQTARALNDMTKVQYDAATGMAIMTDEASTFLSKKAAGSYGIKALTTLMAEGQTGLDEMTAATAEASTAADVSAARTSGLNGAMEALEGTIETFMIKAGTPLIEKFFTPLVSFAAKVVESVIPMLDGFGPALDSVGSVVGGLLEKTQGLGDVEGPTVGAPTAGSVGVNATELATTMMSGLADAITTHLSANSAAYATAITTGMLDILKAVPPKLLLKVPDLAGAHAGVYGAVIGAGIKGLSTLVGGFATTLWDSITGIFDKAGEDADADDAGKTKSSANILGFFNGVMKKFMDGLTGNTEWPKAIGDWILGLVTGLEDFSVAETDKFIALFTGDPDGIITKGIQSIEDEVESIKQAGRDLLSGFFEGLGDSKIAQTGKSVWEKATGWLPKKTKDEYDAHSPSKVMMAIGGDIVEGLGIGISNGIPQVEGSFSGVMDVFDSIVGWLTRFAMVAGSSGMEAAGETFEDIADGIEDMSTAFMQFAQGAKAVKEGELDRGGMIAYLDEWAWAAGQAVIRVQEVVKSVGSETITKMKGRATRLGTILQSLVTDFSKWKPGDMTQMRAYLDQLGVFLPEIVRSLVSMVTDPETGLGSIILDDVVVWSGQLASTFQLMGANLAGIKPSGAKNFLDDASTYLDQVFGFARLVKDKILGLVDDPLAPDAYKAYEDTSKAVPFITGLLGLMGKDLKAELPEEGFEETLPEYLRLAEWALDQIMPSVESMLGEWGQVEGDAKSALEVGSGAVGWITSLLGLGSQKMGAELPEKGYEKRLPEYLRLGEWALDQILPMVGRIVTKYGQAAGDAKSALQVGSEAVGHITSLLGLGSQELKAGEIGEGFAENLPVTLAAAEWAVDQIMPVIDNLIVKWGQAEEGAKSALEKGGEAVGHITGILGLAGLDLSVKTTAGDFQAGLANLLANAKLAMASLMPFLSQLRSTYITELAGVETDTLALNGEIAEKLGPIMDLMGLASTFEALQTRKADPTVRRFAFEVVIARFITQMKEASKQLKVALPEIETIWDGALDTAVTLVEKIAAFFGHIATALKSGEEIALSKGLKPQAVLDSLGVFTEMVTGIQTMGGWQGVLGGIQGGASARQAHSAPRRCSVA